MNIEEQRDLLLSACKSAKSFLECGSWQVDKIKYVAEAIKKCQYAIDAVEKPTEDNQAWFDSSGGSQDV